jgi:hypothetical protein
MAVFAPCQVSFLENVFKRKTTFVVKINVNINVVFQLIISSEAYMSDIVKASEKIIIAEEIMAIILAVSLKINLPILVGFFLANLL